MNLSDVLHLHRVDTVDLRNQRLFVRLQVIDVLGKSLFEHFLFVDVHSLDKEASVPRAEHKRTALAAGLLGFEKLLSVELSVE